jgi:uncharacterized protein involved in exopolysaccharide biosynthesis
METETCNDEINLLDYVKIILKNKWLICLVVGVCVVATAIISLLTAPIFEAKAVIMPVEAPGAQSGMSAMAAQFGISTPNHGQTAEIIGLLKSSLLRERIVRKYNLIPIMFKGGLPKGMTENERIWVALRYLENAIKVIPKQKMNTIEINVTFKDKKLAADIVGYVLVELTKLMSSEEKRVAKANKKRLESTIDQTADPFVKAGIYNLIAKQVEKYAMAEATENFAFKVLDPPRVPDSRIKPKRVQMVIISFIVSLFLGVFVAFGKEYVVNHKKEFSELGKVCGLSEIKWLKWGHRNGRESE